MSATRGDFDEIWDKVGNTISKGFDSKSVDSEKNLKTKIECYEGKVNIYFHNDKIPKEGSHYIFLSVVLIDSNFKMVKNYYFQLFLEECKYIVKEKEVTRHITRDLKISSGNSEESNEE